MSINTDPTGGCAGKFQFKTHGEANRVARKSASRTSSRTHAYKCKTCNFFHWGSTSGKQQRRPRFIDQFE